jgi:hypothetical protein
MNKHLLSVFVLLAFALLALFPASRKSITEPSIKSTGAKIQRPHFLKALAYTAKHIKA